MPGLPSFPAPSHQQNTETALNSTIEAERRVVADLKSRSEAAAQALDKERALVSRLQSELKQAAQDGSRVVSGGWRVAGVGWRVAGVMGLGGGFGEWFADGVGGYLQSGKVAGAGTRG